MSDATYEIIRVEFVDGRVVTVSVAWWMIAVLVSLCLLWAWRKIA